MYKAFAQYLDEFKYQAPQPLNISIKDKTDGTGNNIISQRIKYSAKDECTDISDFNTDNAPAYLKEYLTWSHGGKKEIYKISKERALNYFEKNSSSSSTLFFTLTTPTKATVYNSHYIWYCTGVSAKNVSNILLTKVKNDKQEAVFKQPLKLSKKRLGEICVFSDSFLLSK